MFRQESEQPRKKKSKGRTVKMSLHLSEETNDLLDQLSDDSHMTKSELLRRSIGLIHLAIREKKKGHHFAIMDEEGNKIGDIMGL